MNKETVFLVFPYSEGEQDLEKKFPPEWRNKPLRSYGNNKHTVKITGTKWADLWGHSEALYKKMKRPDHRFIEGFHLRSGIVRVFFGS